MARDMEFVKLEIKADSELMIKQLTGVYKVKNPDIKKIHSEIKKLESAFDSISYTHVRREYNQRADELANLAL